MAYLIPNTGPISVGSSAGVDRSINLLKYNIDNTTTANTLFSLSAESTWFSLNSSSSVLVPNMTAGAPYKFSEFRNASKSKIYQEWSWSGQIDGSDYFSFLPNSNQFLITHGNFQLASFPGLLYYYTYTEDGTVINSGSLPYGYGYNNLPIPVLSATSAILKNYSGRGPITIYQQPSAGNNFTPIVLFNDDGFGASAWYWTTLVLS